MHYTFDKLSTNELRIANYKIYQRKIFFVMLTSLFLLLNSAPTVRAQDKGVPPTILNVSPVLLSITLSPDQNMDYPITLTNQLDAPLPVKVHFADFKTATEDGGYQFVDTKTDPLLSWTSVDQDMFILQPKEEKDIIVTVKTPTTIPFGGYYGMVYFEPMLPTLKDQTKVLARIAVLMLGSVGIYDPSAINAQILDFSTPAFLQQDNSIPILLRVKNTSINHFSAKPYFAIKPLFGKDSNYELEEKYVFPEKVRRWHVDLGATLTPGIYFTTMAVSIGGGKQIIESSQFIIYPTTQTLSILAGLSLLILLSIYRKRVKNAVTILFFDRSPKIPKIKETSVPKIVTKLASKKRKITKKRNKDVLDIKK